MGSSSSKDKNITLFASTERNLYRANDEVRGQAFLNCKGASPAPYGQFNVMVIGHEYKEKTGFSSETNGEIQTYNTHFNIANFEGRLPPGQYIIPFSFKIPNNIVSSLYFRFNQDLICVIRYSIVLELKNVKDKSMTQLFELPLNITNSRGPNKALFFQKNYQYKICKCLSYTWNTKIQFGCSNNEITVNQPFRLFGLIDNSDGFQAISKVHIIIEENIIKNQNLKNLQGKQLGNAVRFYQLAEFQQIPKGKTKNFDCMVVVPKDFAETVIGYTIARFHKITLFLSYPISGHNYRSSIYVRVINPQTELGPAAKKELKKPPITNPAYYPMVICDQMQEFVFRQESESAQNKEIRARYKLNEQKKPRIGWKNSASQNGGNQDVLKSNGDQLNYPVNPYVSVNQNNVGNNNPNSDERIELDFRPYFASSNEEQGTNFEQLKDKRSYL